MTKETSPAADRLFRIITCGTAISPPMTTLRPTSTGWRELKRQIARMRGGLVLFDIHIAGGAQAGIPFTADTARKLEQHTRFGLSESED